MFKYRLVIDQVMKPKDWVMLVILIAFTAGSLYLVWQEFQEPIVFYEVSNVEKNIWQTEKTKQGTIVRNLDAGYEVVVPENWDIALKEKVLKAHNDFDMPEAQTEAPTGCILSVSSDSSSYSNVSEWLIGYDNERRANETEEIGRTVVVGEKKIKINDLELFTRTYEPPIGPNYQEYYTYKDGNILIINQVIGVVGGNYSSCNAGFGLMVNSFKLL